MDTLLWDGKTLREIVTGAIEYIEEGMERNK